MKELPNGSPQRCWACWLPRRPASLRPSPAAPRRTSQSRSELRMAAQCPGSWQPPTASCRPQTCLHGRIHLVSQCICHWMSHFLSMPELDTRFAPLLFSTCSPLLLLLARQCKTTQQEQPWMLDAPETPREPLWKDQYYISRRLQRGVQQ